MCLETFRFLFVPFSRVRRAIEDATGIYTGSSMNEEYFHKLGFEGELEQYASGRVIASKNQGIAFVEYTEGMIVLGTGPQIFSLNKV